MARRKPKLRGRPRVISEKIQREVVAALQANATYEIAAQYAGISYAGLNHWVKRGRAEVERVADARDAVRKYINDPAYVESLSIYLDQWHRHHKNKKYQIKAKRPRVPAEMIRAVRINPFERDYVNFFKAINEASAVAAVQWLQVIDAAANQDPAWAAWMLKTRYPQQYGGQRSSEVSVATSSNGAAGQTETLIRVVYGDNDNRPNLIQEDAGTNRPDEPPAP